MQQGWEKGERGKSGSGKLGGPCVHTRTREPAHPSYPVSLSLVTGTYAAYLLGWFSHNLLCGLQLPPRTTCFNSQHVKLRPYTCTYRSGETIQMADNT